MVISPFGACHFSGRYQESCEPPLADEEYHQISARSRMALSDIKVLIFHSSLLRPANVGEREEDFLYFFCGDAVLLFDLGKKLVIPNDIVKAQAKHSSPRVHSLFYHPCSPKE